jgi:hypothetical protein
MESRDCATMHESDDNVDVEVSWDNKSWALDL